MELTISWCNFDRQSGDPEKLIKPDRQPGEADTGGKIRCRACHQLITEPGQACKKDASHIHLCTNPHGHSFRFACFREAPGCTQVGGASREHSWFTGHSWQIAICASCGEHLGWLFRGESRFYGLILNRLINESQE